MIKRTKYSNLSLGANMKALGLLCWKGLVPGWNTIVLYLNYIMDIIKLEISIELVKKSIWPFMIEIECWNCLFICRHLGSFSLHANTKKKMDFSLKWSSIHPGQLHTVLVPTVSPSSLMTIMTNHGCQPVSFIHPGQLHTVLYLLYPLQVWWKLWRTMDVNQCPVALMIYVYRMLFTLV